MSMLRKIIEKFATAIVTRRQISRFNCEGCDLRDYCSLPAERRQLCWELAHSVRAETGVKATSPIFDDQDHYVPLKRQ